MKIKLNPKTGKYDVQIRYVNYAGKSVNTTRRGFNTQREAKQAALELQIKAAGLPTMTVSQLVAEMMETQKPRLRPNSIRQKDMLYRLYICNRVGQMRICDITPRTILHWQNDLPKDKSASTIAAANAAFSALLTYAVKFHNLPSNPFKIAGKTGCFEQRNDFWEEGHYNKFIQAVDSPLWHLVFNLIFYCGLRRSEVPPLTYSDIDFDAGTLSINKSLDDEGRLGPPKHNSSRVIALPQFLLDELKAFRALQYGTPTLIFPISYAMIKLNFAKYCKRVELPHMTVHGLRHSHCSMLLQKHVPITTVSKRLGHASCAITLRQYSHAYAEGDRETAALLDSLVKNTCSQNVVTAKSDTSPAQ